MGEPTVLVTGVSTRAAAESAARAGLDVLALDAFADLDHHPAVRVWSLPRDFGLTFTPRHASRVAATMAADAAVYLSSFENHPAAVAGLAAGRTLWGNGPAVLRRVRNPFELARAFLRAGLEVPLTRRRSPHADDVAETARWLIKPRSSGGGHGVRAWSPGTAVPRGHYLQQRVDGTSGSVVFVAARHRAVPLGVSRQLIGEAAFGASGYRYCGSIVAPGQFPCEDDIRKTAGAMASVAAAEFGLVGVGSVDFVATGRVPYPVELNPRWTASMELVEQSRGLSLFGLHAQACRYGQLPAFPLTQGRLSAAVGKAVVFARANIQVGDTRDWLEDPTVRDVPRPGVSISRGEPICTVFAEAADAESCHERLVERAARVYRDVARKLSTSARTSSGLSSLG